MLSDLQHIQTNDCKTEQSWEIDKPTLDRFIHDDFIIDERVETVQKIEQGQRSGNDEIDDEILEVPFEWMVEIEFERGVVDEPIYSGHDEKAIQGEVDSSVENDNEDMFLRQIIIIETGDLDF